MLQSVFFFLFSLLTDKAQREKWQFNFCNQVSGYWQGDSVCEKIKQCNATLCKSEVYEDKSSNKKVFVTCSEHFFVYEFLLFSFHSHFKVTNFCSSNRHTFFFILLWPRRASHTKRNRLKRETVQMALVDTAHTLHHLLRTNGRFSS